MSLRKESNLKTAAKEPVNLFGVAGLFALSLATLNPLPLLFGAVAEVVYLLFVPDSKWYAERLETIYDKEVEERRQRLKKQVWETLSPQVQSRFTRLENLRTQLVSPTYQGRKVYRAVMRKLDYLLEKFLLFASKQVQFHQYLLGVLGEVTPVTPGPPPAVFDDQGRPVKKKAPKVTRASMDDEWIRTTVDKVKSAYQAEIDEMNESRTAVENLHNQALLDKRVEILMRRQEYVQKIGEALSNLQHQLDLMEDTFGLINDEIRARSPEQMLADIDDVVLQTDTLTEALQEVAPFDTMQVEEGAQALYNVPGNP